MPMTSATVSSETRSSRAISADRGLALVGLREDAVGPLDALEQLFLAVRQADGAAAVDEGAGDSLLDPPGRIGGKADVPGAVVFFRGLYEAYVPFLYQVEQRHIRRDEAAGDLDDETKVRLDQSPPRLLVAAEDASGEIALFVGGQKGYSLDDRVIAAKTVFGTVGFGNCFHSVPPLL